MSHTKAFYSRNLRRYMKYRVYGESGKPVVAFPTSEAHYSQWEDFGMVDAISSYIDDGLIQLWTVDSIDEQTFFRPRKNWRAAMKRHEQWFGYLHEEFLPMVKHVNHRANRWAGWQPETGGSGLMLTGCSMGAYHAANYFFRNPYSVDSVIALSGVYNPDSFTEGFMTPPLRANSPLDYLQDPIPPARRRAYEAARLVFCAGQGAGEEEMFEDTEALDEVLEEQGIHAWVDIWGEEAEHDWVWWNQQLVYYLDHVLTDAEDGSLERP